jgi:hypothetical protein
VRRAREDLIVTDTEKPNEKQPTEIAPEQEDLSAEELAKISGGDLYMQPRGQNDN